PPSSLFRLPVDRVFTMKGFGTVITGTLTSGRIRVGDPIMIYPSGITSKVRGIQVHNQAVEEAEAGTRTAINFQGLEKAAVQRGEVLADPGSLVSSYMVDISLHFLKSNKKPVKNRVRVRFHGGTSEILGNLILLDRDELPPGETIVAQLRLDAPTALVKDDRFVIRSYSPVRTIGGGHVLNPMPRKHKRFKPEVIEGLKSLDGGDPEGVISYHLTESGYLGASLAQLKIMTNMSVKPLNTVLQGLLSRREIIMTDKENRTYIHGSCFGKLTGEIRDGLGEYHRVNPLKSGMPKEELRSKFPTTLGAKLFNQGMNQLMKEKAIVQEGDMVRLAGHKVSLKVDQSDVK
ncbi:MAG: selenocysteine-specific translation factor, partial [Desulfobacterales bacterium]|nr:selenocysteine-specific translation factor [Desulfobacterales bacterium]